MKHRQARTREREIKQREPERRPSIPLDDIEEQRRPAKRPTTNEEQQQREQDTRPPKSTDRK